MANERDLRAKLRDTWCGPGELVWVEAAMGGTVGAPDVFVPLGTKRGYLPLELKWWNVSGGMIEFEARPAQRRFHRMAYDAGQRTAFLAMLPTGQCVLLPGSKMPVRNELNKLSTNLFRFVLSCAMVRETLLDEEFWRGKAR